MAAKLKKRALAEFSRVVTEEPQVVKKLRLVQRSSVPTISLNLNGATSSQDVLFILLKLSNNIPTDKEAAESVYSELSEHLAAERDPIVRCKIISIYARLALVPGFCPQMLVDDILSRTSTEKSHKVLCQLFQSAKDISQVFSSSSPYIKKFMLAAYKNVSHCNHCVRSSCLQLIGRLASCETQSKDTPASPDWPVSVQELLTRYIGDPDPRVRCSAFEAMLSLHTSGQPVALSVYQQACSALSDDYEGVRLAAIQLIWVVAHFYPESPVPVSDSNGEELRLIDDGFAKICNMVTDISIKVKVKACSLLGSLHLVSPKFLEQTLDKKIMSQLRRKRSAHERAREQFSSGEWSSGQKWADDAPKEGLDPDSVSLLNIGACGAFVHGLEDEFLDVRNAALDSLCELAANSAPFSQLSQDSIIDMFNDEIESVRLNAINSLRKISHHLLLREDQAEIIMGVLQDYSHVSREALRDLLSSVQLATKAGINSCVMGLLDNLQRYPQDRVSIWKCARQLGRHHPAHVLALVTDLLCLHPYFDTPEPEMDDPAYVTVLILVLNAAANCPSMVPLFPEHTRRHYSYLRSSLPQHVPRIQSLEAHEGDGSLGGAVSGGGGEGEHSSSLDAGRFVSELTGQTGQLSQLGSMDTEAAVALLEVAVRDLERTKQLSSEVAATADCTCVYLQSQLLLTKLLTRVNNSSECIADTETVTSAVDKILELTTRLQTVFLGVSSDSLWSVRQLELKALTLQMTVTLSRGSLAEKVRTCDTFRQFIALMKRSLETEPGQMEPVTQHLLSRLDHIDPSKLQGTHSVLQTALTMLRPTAVPRLHGVRRVNAVLQEPLENLEKTVRMAAGLTAGVCVVATLENVRDTQAVRIQVRYPDQQSQLIQPPASAWTRLSPLKHRLNTEVVMSHALWSESCNVEISLAMEPCGQARTLLKKQDVVELTKPVKILVSTKAHKS